MTEHIALQPCYFVNLEKNIGSDPPGAGNNIEAAGMQQAGLRETPPVVRTRFLTDEDLSPSHVVHKSPAMFCILSSSSDDDDTPSQQPDGEDSNTLGDLKVILGPTPNHH